MQFLKTSIPGVLKIENKVFPDERGFFMETYRSSLFAEAGIPYQFVQDNHSASRKGILRGLHYQIERPQGKLVRVVVGEIFDVVVDLRRKSPTFGKWLGERLSAENKTQLWIPPGLAHGFYVFSDLAEFVYKTTDYYASDCERTLLWNDPEVGVDWPLSVGEVPLISQKDSQGKHLSQFLESELFD